MKVVMVDEREIAHTYIGKVRKFMRDFGVGDRSPADLETALESAGLMIALHPEPKSSDTNGVRT